MISVENLNFAYEDKKVLEKIAFKIEPGSCVGIIGPNGSGKTTLIKIISGIIDKYQGKVCIDNNDIRKIKRKEFARKVAVVPQNLELFFPYKVKEIILSGRYPYITAGGGYTKSDYDKCRECIREFGLENMGDKLADKLSGGEKQRVFIAKAVAGEGEIIILDEPTSNLDPGHVIELLGILKRLNRERGKTVIFVSHDINAVAEICDTVMVLAQGKIEAFGKIGDILTEETLKKVYGVDFEVSKDKRGVPFVRWGKAEGRK